MSNDGTNLHPEMPDDSSNYRERQIAHNHEYQDAWKNAPEEFKKKAALLGLHSDVDEYEGMTLEYDETKSKVYDPGHSPSFVLPDMAKNLDNYVDQVVEKFGLINEKMVREIAAELKKPMEEEIIRNRSLLLGRALCYLVGDEKGNVLARIHALLHSIPRLASIAGFPSMRSSAKNCKVSPEWLRRTRDHACSELGLEVPADGKKSDEAKAKYKANALSDNHWRRQLYKAKPIAE